MTKNTKNNYAITIVWWTSWFWEWIALYLINHFWDKVNITLTWRNIEKWNEASKKLWCNFSDDNILAVKSADITIFSVPICYMEQTIKEVAPSLKEWSIVLDVCSIKKVPSIALNKYSPKWVIIIPTHPMFWPYIDTLAWQIFVLTPEEEVKNKSEYKSLKNFLKWVSAVVIEENPEKHDKMMAVVQWLTHYNMFVYWETIKRLWIDIKDSMNFVSPIYKLVISSVSRYMNQDAKLYWDIQMYNDENLKVHKTFIEVTNEFSELIKEKDEEGFIDMIDWTKGHFWDNALKWQNYTDKIIYMLSNQIDKINSNIWKNITLQSIDSSKKVEWKLIKFEDNLLYLDSWKNYDLDKYHII